MDYHILQTHPTMGRVLSARYPPSAALRKQAESAAGDKFGWTYLAVECKANPGRDCECSNQDRFKEE